MKFDLGKSNATMPADGVGKRGLVTEGPGGIVSNFAHSLRGACGHDNGICKAVVLARPLKT